MFPVGVEFHTSYMEYEMILQAFSDGEAYAMPYPTLKRIAVENGAFAGELLRENCDFIGYLFFDTLNQTFEPCLSRVCDILYLYLTKVQPKEPVIPLSQGELAKIAGASQAQMERCVQILKKEEVLATSRKQLAILDEKNCWPTARRACGKICEKKRRFPSCEGERFSVVWYAGDKEIPTRSDHT